jgi:D-alanyl-D-alanine carboxypeptidase (penicillin-binding protein 5/6)
MAPAPRWPASQYGKGPRAACLSDPKGSGGDLHATVTASSGLIAPVSAHQQVGTLDVSVGDRVLARVPLYTLQAVPQGNIFRRLFDTVRLWFKK